jgi:hypothetical protein
MEINSTKIGSERGESPKVTWDDRVFKGQKQSDGKLAQLDEGDARIKIITICKAASCEVLMGIALGVFSDTFGKSVTVLTPIRVMPLTTLMLNSKALMSTPFLSKEHAMEELTYLASIVVLVSGYYGCSESPASAIAGLISGISASFGEGNCKELVSSTCSYVLCAYLLNEFSQNNTEFLGVLESVVAAVAVTVVSASVIYVADAVWVPRKKD